MRTKGLSVSALLCLARVLSAADCDCTHFPIEPSACVTKCQAALLQKTSKDDLTSKLKLNPATAADVVHYRAVHEIKDVSALKDKLPSSEVAEIKVKLEDLKPEDSSVLAKEYGFSKIEQGSATKHSKAEKKNK